MIHRGLRPRRRCNRRASFTPVRSLIVGVVSAFASPGCAGTDCTAGPDPVANVVPGDDEGLLVTLRSNDPITMGFELGRAIPSGVFQGFQAKLGGFSPALVLLTNGAGDRLAVARMAGGLSALVDLGEQHDLVVDYGIESLPHDFDVYPSIRMERGELVVFGQRSFKRTKPLRGIEPLSRLDQWPEIAIAVGHVYLLRFVPDGAVPDGSGDRWWKWLVVEHHPGQSVTLRVQRIEQLAEPVGEH